MIYGRNDRNNFNNDLLSATFWAQLNETDLKMNYFPVH